MNPWNAKSNGAFKDTDEMNSQIGLFHKVGRSGSQWVIVGNLKYF
jgi:hypothetical protein